MKAVTLIPLLAALTSSLALTEHPNAEALARRINPRRHHANEVERMIKNIQEREAGATEQAPSVQKRQVIKKGQTCRPRQQAPVAVPSSSTTSAAATTASPSPSAAAGGNGNANAGNGAASPSPAASSAAATQAPATGNSNHGANSGGLTPNGKKAGMTAGDSVAALSGLLGWYSTWDASDAWNNFGGNPLFVPMLWGGGSTDGKDAARVADFKSLNYVPQFIQGMNEPDCASGGDMSAGMSIAATAALWNELMVPRGNQGSLLLSPTMCKQKDENGWLKEFQGQISRDFDITAIHVNKNNIAGAKADIDYYANTYGKPIWITEFACVDDANGFTPCTDQGQIDQYIRDFVDLAESDSRVYAYAYSNGNGLGNVWPSWSNGQLSASGQTYKAALQKYYH